MSAVRLRFIYERKKTKTENADQIFRRAERACDLLYWRREREDHRGYGYGGESFRGRQKCFYSAVR